MSAISLILAICIWLTSSPINIYGENNPENFATENIKVEILKNKHNIESNVLDKEILENMNLDLTTAYLLEKAMYHHLFGLNLYYEGEYRAAINQLSIANNIAPKNTAILVRLGDLYEKIGQNKQAKSYRTRALQINSEIPIKIIKDDSDMEPVNEN